MKKLLKPKHYLLIKKLKKNNQRNKFKNNIYT